MVINKEQFQAILNSTRPGLATKEVVEQTGSFLFKGGRVITYNDEISVSAPVPLDLEGAVPAKELYTLLTKTKEDSLDISSGEKTIIIKGKSMEVSLAKAQEISLPLDDIPWPDDSAWVSLGLDFVDKLKMCLFSVSKNMARPVLTCVHWQDDFIETTDNLRVMRCQISSKMPEGVKVLLPGSSATSLTKYNPVAFSVIEDWLHFKTSENAVFSCRTYEGVFPEVSRVLATECPALIKFPARLIDILSRAMVFAPKDTVGDCRTNINIDGNTLTVIANNEVGNFKEDCMVRSQDNLSFVVNPEALQEILKHHTKAGVAHRPDGAGACYLKFEGEFFTHLMAVA